MRWMVIIATLALGLPCTAEPLKLATGDRVVFIGGTVVERDQQFGWFEAKLHARFPKADFVFRNLGWSGDTVWGEARAEFGTPAEGYKKLLDETVAAKPTVLLIQYGANESFAGEMGIGSFIQQYSKLLDDLAGTKAKIWLIGPNKLVSLPSPLPDPQRHNRDVLLYSEAIAKLANQRSCGFVDLFQTAPANGSALSDDEMHYNADGARWFADVMMTQLTGETFTANAKQSAAFDALRLKTIEKNRQFFYRWRPQNDTYIFGFRKYEQGQNAVEIPQFDPIVQKLDEEITAMSARFK